MIQKTLKGKSIYLWISFLMITVFVNITAGQKKNDVRPGMDIENAVNIVKSCVHEAAGIRDSKIRPGDTLDFLGITNELRLDALRRYIVRNTELGVQSIWVSHPNKKRLSQHFIISNDSLKKVDKTWTVEKLAKTISTSAGLPNLTYQKSAQIVADCRDWALSDNPALRKPKKGDAKLPEISTAKSIKSDLTDKIDNFIKILLENKKAGIKSAGITSPSGDSYSYLFSQSIIEQQIITNGIKNLNWTYSDLIKFIYEYAEVPLSPELTATQLVLNAILDSVPSTNTQFGLNNTKNLKNHKRDQEDSVTFKFSELFSDGVKIKENYTLKDLGIPPETLKNKLVELLSPSVPRVGNITFETSIQTFSKNNQLLQTTKVSRGDFSFIKETTTVGELIDETTALLEKQLP